MITRRHVLAATALTLLPKAVLAQSAAIGTTISVSGQGRLMRGGAEAELHAADMLAEGDQVSIGAESSAALELFTKTMLNLGPGAQLVLDRFTAELGGTITLGGPMVFDRAETLPKLNLTVQNVFAQIGVRGTRFFAGPSKGVYAVFVARGAVEVAAGGEVRRLGAGEGVDIAEAGAAPGAVAKWGEARIAAAFASVGLTP